MKKKFLTMLLISTVGGSTVLNTNVLAKDVSKIVHNNQVVEGTEGEDADVNDQIEMPEKGWTRYDDTNLLIQYIGNYKQLSYPEYYLETLSLVWGVDSEVKFVVDGTSFRMIVGTVPTKDGVTTNKVERFKADLYVDGEYVKTINHSSSKLNYPIGNRIEFDYEFDEKGKHEVSLKLTSAKDEVHIDAIDVIGKLVQQKVIIDNSNNELKPLYKYYRASDNSYCYSMDNVKTINGDYVNNGIQEYVYATKVDNTVELQEYYCNVNKKYYYTIDSKLLNNDKRFDYKGSRCYINAEKAQQIIVREKPQLQETIPFYRYCRVTDNDHFYTANYNELGQGNGLYVYEKIQCKVFKEAGENLVPLYRYCLNENNYHFYTTNFNELGYGNAAWSYENIAAYVYDKQVEGSIPLYRYTKKDDLQHFYTTNFNEIGYGNGVYDYEGIQCYVLP